MGLQPIGAASTGSGERVPAGPSIRAWGLLRVGGAVEKGQLPLYVYLDYDFLLHDGQLFRSHTSADGQGRPK